MRTFFTAAALSLLAACAGPGVETSHWYKTGASEADFQSDNQRCGAKASEGQPAYGSDQSAGGVVPPDNRMDRPPRKSTNAAADNAYHDCMAKSGWRVVSR